MPNQPAPLNYAAPSPKTWRVGTLVYTRAMLFNVFFWMLWGDFCLNLMDSGVIPTLVPLQLRALGASNTLIGTLTGTALSVMNFALVPIISTASDRHRGPLGRRMPFMLYATPPLALFLIMLGFSTHTARFVLHLFPWLAAHFSIAHVTIAVIAVYLIGYKFFDLFPQSVYYYLFPDVIPQGLMGTFACLFRVVATAGSFVFNRFLLAHAETHPTAIYLGSALLYMLAFVLLCFMVKEGKYPPPDPVDPRAGMSGGLLGVTQNYLRACFSMGYYWKFYLMNLCFICGFAPVRIFMIFYGTKQLNLAPQTYGNIMATRDLVQVGVFFLLGPIVDKLHPLRAGMIGYLFVLAASLCSFMFIRGSVSFAILIIALYVAVAVYQGATGALGPRLLPREQYGQFCSANAMIVQLGMIVTGIVSGMFLDAMKNYAYIFVWFFAFCSVGFVLMLLLYREWKKLGGDENYVPPIKALAVA